MLGIGFDINNVADDILPLIDIINIENPLYTNEYSGVKSITYPVFGNQYSAL